MHSTPASTSWCCRRRPIPRELAAIASTLAGAGPELVDGLEVELWGQLDPNPGFGRLHLLAHGVDPLASMGAAVVARDAVVAELETSGRLDAQQRLALSDVVRRIGLVSSPAAAGCADVLAVLERSPLTFEVVEASAAMGGSQAPGEVATALDILASAGIDVGVVARGGGGTGRVQDRPGGAALGDFLERCHGTFSDTRRGAGGDRTHARSIMSALL